MFDFKTDRLASHLARFPSPHVTRPIGHVTRGAVEAGVWFRKTENFRRNSFSGIEARGRGRRRRKSKVGRNCCRRRCRVLPFDGESNNFFRTGQKFDNLNMFGFADVNTVDLFWKEKFKFNQNVENGPSLDFFSFLVFFKHPWVQFYNRKCEKFVIQRWDIQTFDHSDKSLLL